MDNSLTGRVSGQWCPVHIFQCVCKFARDLENTAQTDNQSGKTILPKTEFLNKYFVIKICVRIEHH